MITMNLKLLLGIFLLHIAAADISHNMEHLSELTFIKDLMKSSDFIHETNNDYNCSYGEITEICQRNNEHSWTFKILQEVSIPIPELSIGILDASLTVPVNSMLTLAYDAASSCNTEFNCIRQWAIYVEEKSEQQKVIKPIPDEMATTYTHKSYISMTEETAGDIADYKFYFGFLPSYVIRLARFNYQKINAREATVVGFISPLWIKTQGFKIYKTESKIQNLTKSMKFELYNGTSLMNFDYTKLWHLDLLRYYMPDGSLELEQQQCSRETFRCVEERSPYKPTHNSFKNALSTRGKLVLANQYTLNYDYNRNVSKIEQMSIDEYYFGIADQRDERALYFYFTTEASKYWTVYGASLGSNLFEFNLVKKVRYDTNDIEFTWNYKSIENLQYNLPGSALITENNVSIEVDVNEGISVKMEVMKSSVFHVLVSEEYYQSRGKRLLELVVIPETFGYTISWHYHKLGHLNIILGEISFMISKLLFLIHSLVDNTIYTLLIPYYQITNPLLGKLMVYVKAFTTEIFKSGFILNESFVRSLWNNYGFALQLTNLVFVFEDDELYISTHCLLPDSKICSDIPYPVIAFWETYNFLTNLGSVLVLRLIDTINTRDL